MQISDIVFMRNVVLLAGFLTSFSLSAFGQTQLIQDGDFESPNFAVWTIAGAGATIANNSANARSGTHYLTMGNIATAAPQTAYQTITIPSNTVAAIFSYFYNVFSPGSSAVDQFQVVLRRTDGSLIAPLDLKNGGNNNDGAQGIYHPLSFNLTAYAGQTVLV